MADAAQLVTFMGVVLLGAMLPGPDFVVVTRHAALSGRRVGMSAALGIAAGILVWAVIAAFGLAALLAASATAFTVVKLVGAAYLVFLGVRSWIAAVRGGKTSRPGGPGRGVGPGAAFRQALLTNLLNPKCGVFFVALVPQFMPRDTTWVRTLLLAALTVLLTAAWFVLVASIVGALRRSLTRPRVRRGLDAVMGTTLVGLGVGIATDST